MPSKGTSVSHSTPAQLGSNSWGELRRRSSDIPWVLAGGVCGTLARYFLSFAGGSLWILVAINLLGCFLLGVIVGLRRTGLVTSLGYAFWGTGLMGSFTTFSGVMVLLVAPWADIMTWLVILTSIAAGIGLAWAGRAWAERSGASRVLQDQEQPR